MLATMAERKVLSPKVLLLLGAAVLVLTSAAAIFFAAGYTPETGSRETVPTIETSTPPMQPPPPPIMMPPGNPQVPCMIKGEGGGADNCQTPAPAN